MRRSVWSTVVDVCLVFTAACFLLGGGLPLEDAGSSRSSGVAPVVAGVLAGLAGLGILGIVTLGRARRRPRRIWRRLTGVLATLIALTLFPMMAFNAAYFGEARWALLVLAFGVVVGAMGVRQLHHS